MTVIVPSSLPRPTSSRTTSVVPRPLVPVYKDEDEGRTPSGRKQPRPSSRRFEGLS